MAKFPLLAGPLRFSGWEFEGEVPPEKKYVCIAAPHTSNWDGALLVALTRSVGLSIRWMIKSEWLRGPSGAMLRRLGAIGIDRSASHNMVGQMIDELNRAERLILVIPPEATRKRADYWKSGFYRIAREAQLPVTLGYVDSTTKTTGLGPTIDLTGDIPSDMDRIRAFYADKSGKIPEHRVEPRLREELAT